MGVQQPSGAPRILVVEDDPEMRQIIGTVLGASVSPVLDVGSAREAEAVLATPDQPIDLMLTDVVLPDGEGCSLAIRARALRPDLRILFMSGYEPDMLVKLGVTNGPFLRKPFTAEKLRNRVREQLGRPVEALR